MWLIFDVRTKIIVSTHYNKNVVNNNNVATVTTFFMITSQSPLRQSSLYINYYLTKIKLHAYLFPKILNADAKLAAIASIKSIGDISNNNNI